MSKTKKITRARKARDRALVEAKQATEELATVRLLTQDVRKKWGYILEMLAHALPREDFIRAMAEGIPEMRVNYDSDYTHALKAAERPRFVEMVSSQADRMIESRTFNFHQLITLYAEDRGSREPRLIFDLKFNDGHSRYAMTESGMMMAPERFIIEDVASRLTKHMRGQSR